MSSIRIGLVGSGPWAHLVHGPMLSSSNDLELTAIWSRNFEKTAEMAHEFGGVACASFKELLDRCDAVAFAVPPHVQWELASMAARAGKHLLLEKPIADTVENATQLADAIATAGVQSIVNFSYRFAPEVRNFIAS